MYPYHYTNFLLVLEARNTFFPQYVLPSNNFFTGITTRVPYRY